MTGNQLVTASTDNTVKLWSLQGTSSAAPALHSTNNAESELCGNGGMSGVLIPYNSSIRPAAPPSSGAPACSMTYTGHLNERNFVGLSVTAEGYIACGSENNTAFCYYKVCAPL